MEHVPSTTQSTVTLAAKDREADSKYDPFEHRKVQHPTSTLGAFFHLLKSSLGTGLLAMPAAFRNTGLVPGCIGTVLVGVIATHCVHILVSTSREVCKENRVPLMSYTNTCEGVFKLGPKKLRPYSKHIRHFVDAAMAGVCIGGTSVYVIFIASSLKDLFDNFAPEHKYGVEVHCGIILLPLILITQIRHLKFLVPFSLLANLCLLVTFCVTCYYTFTDLPPLDRVEMVASVHNWPLFLSTAIFAMEGINVVMPVENEMSSPRHFLGCPGVLNVTMVFVALLYGTVGVFGYLKYGDEVQGSITLNLPEDEVLALTAKILVAVAVFFTYCLQMYAPMDIIWTRVSPSVRNEYHNVCQILIRTASVCLTVILAVAIPDLELLIGLVGAIFFSTLGLLIPVAMQTVHKWERGLGKLHYILWKNVLLLAFYVIVLVSGCYSAISAIVTKFRVMIVSFKDCEKPYRPYIKDSPVSFQATLHNTTNSILMSGNITVARDTRNAKLRIKIMIWENGGWRTNFLLNDIGCHSMALQLISRGINIKYDRKTCTYIKGQYIFKNLDMNSIHHLWTSEMEYGRMFWQAELFNPRVPFTAAKPTPSLHLHNIIHAYLHVIQ